MVLASNCQAVIGEKYMRILVFIFIFVLNVGLVDASAQATKDSPNLRDTWSRILETADLQKFSELLYESQRASFPSVANEVATSVAFQSEKLLERERWVAQIPEFRIEAAHYLALAFRSGAFRGDASAIRNLAKDYLKKHPDAKAVSKALLTLAHLQNSRDVPEMMHVANSEDPNRYRVAIYALRIMCIREAQISLEKLRTERISREKQKTIDDSEKFLAICPK